MPQVADPPSWGTDCGGTAGAERSEPSVREACPGRWRSPELDCAAEMAPERADQHETVVCEILDSPPTHTNQGFAPGCRRPLYMW